MSNTGNSFTPSQLSEIRALHRKWIGGEPGGVRANLSVADLAGANLSGADLAGANLEGVTLRGAILTRANLRYAILCRVVLAGADLGLVDLRDANLTGANLTGANLTGANLTGANLTGANLPSPVIDLTGCKTGYKKVWNKDRTEHLVIELRFPEGSELVSTVIGRKCRASEAEVVRCVTPGHENDTMFRSFHDHDFIYCVGSTVKPEKCLDSRVTIECTSGIHFFVTREEAEAYGM